MRFDLWHWEQTARVSTHETVGGFTLLEVILAVAIASGILFVALVLYHQAAQVRAQILEESDRLSSIRLALDRVASDLRTAQAVAAAGNEFVGDATSMRFARLALATPMTGLGDATVLNQTDWMRIFLMTTLQTNGTQIVVGALNRREEPVRARSVLSESRPLGVTDALVNATNKAVETLSEYVRFVRFRYWNGSGWASSWSNAMPPAGVEIVLSAEAMAEDAQPEALPPEPFRRVVYLPAGSVNHHAETNLDDVFAR
jgi:type II secretory pathway pseudopilin PulG